MQICDYIHSEKYFFTGMLLTINIMKDPSINEIN